MINYDLKFLTSDDSVSVKNVDFKTCKYETKKKNDDSTYDVGKRSYCERRGGLWRPPRPRLLRELETKVRERSVVFCEWLTETLVVIVFSSGTIAYLTINPDSLDVTQILFDRYCVGKMAGQAVTGVAFSSTHLLFTHSELTATLVTFGPYKNASGRLPFRIADRNPHVQSIELADGARRAERRVSWGEVPAAATGPAGTSGGPRVLVWTAAGAEPAPWSPAADARANLHLYQLRGQQINVVAYHQLENETLSAEVSRTHHNAVHIVEQTICHKSGVSLEWSRYEVSDSQEGVVRLSQHRTGTCRVTLPAVARATRRAACDTRLLVACVDGTLLVVHRAAGVTHSARAGFIASELHWAQTAVLCAEEGARLHCFDRALAPLQHTQKCLQLAHHVRDNSRMQILSTQSIKGGALLLTSFTGGPLALLRVTHPQLPMGWIRSGRMPRAVALLRAMDWELEGDLCLHAVQSIAAETWRKPLRAGSEAALQAALGTYLAATVPPAAAKYRPPVTDLARKFFHHLLRRGRYDKALSLAVDLNAWDLFMDARWALGRAARTAMAEEAQALAEECFRNTPDSVCSDSCCSCSASDGEGVHTLPPPLPRATAPTQPPLPREGPPLPRVHARGTEHAVKLQPSLPRDGVHTQPSLPREATLCAVPVRQPEAVSTNSIRPNLHQYLERDLTIWNTDVRDNPTHRVKWHSMDDVLTVKRPLNTIVEQAAYRKTSDGARPQDVRSCRYQNSYPSVMGDGRTMADRGRTNGRYPEKNVKFCDTVTISVMSQVRGPSPSRELAESLPLCAPHAYLAAFEPARPATAASAATAPPTGRPTDYVEV